MGRVGPVLCMTSRASSPTVLRLGNYRPALTVARSLRARGHQIWVSRDNGSGAAHASRAVTGIWDDPGSTDPALQYDALAAFLAERPDIEIVFPLQEHYVRGFFANRHRLPDDRLYIMPNRTAAEICADKSALLDIVTEAGLPCARNATVYSLDELHSAQAQIGFPLVVKPVDSTIWLGAQKVLICRDAAEFAAAFPAWPAPHSALIVQTYVDGPRVNLYFAAKNGRPIRYLAARIGATDLRDGTGLATDGVTIPVEPRLREMADALLEILDYHGVGCIQVLQDRHTGALSFLEINARIGGNHAITDHCGMGLDSLALDLAAGHPVADRLVIGRSGVRYVWTKGALRGAASALRHGETGRLGFALRVARALRLAVTTRAQVTFCWSDPLPSLVILGQGAPNALRSVRRGTRRASV
ncbi:MAG: ATP-grasp domain-containing protein [Pseudomonadota bacterium]